VKKGRVSMDQGLQTRLHADILDRREKIQAIIGTHGPHTQLLHLLGEIDRALEKIAVGSYGLCETCHDSIEAERIAIDPLCRNCLDHLSREEQKVLEQDLDLAYQVQRRLLPKEDLTLGPWTSAYHYDPVGPVSGDYCDIVVPQDAAGRVYFFVGDVSGKGVAASLLMAQLNAIIRSLVPKAPPIAQLVEEANRLFCEGSPKGHFATLAGGLAHPDGRVEIFNAGHPPPLHIHGGASTSIRRTGLPLGALCGSSFLSTEIRMAHGDRLVLYTDGMTETRNLSGEFFGEERVERTLLGHRGRGPRSAVDHLLGEVRVFGTGTQRIDDLTLLVVERS
jgi:sigma-B regulation protein RsbU (phosphoserine phosphatase)